MLSYRTEPYEELFVICNGAANWHMALAASVTN